MILLAACTSTDGTGDDTPTPSSPIACALQDDNVLRVDCALELPGTLTYTDSTGESVTLEVEAGTVTLWGLRADTDYDVEVVDTDGTHTATFRTGSIPSDLASASVEVTGTSSLEAVAQVLSCGQSRYVVVLDTQGALRWYQPLAEVSGGGGGGMQMMGPPGFSVTDTSTFLVLDGAGIQEWSLPGELVRSFSTELGLHHDLVRSGDETLALFNESIEGPDGEDYLLDGVAVFDAGGALVRTWHLADHIEPDQLTSGGGPPDGMGGGGMEAIDWSHANGITVAEDGDWIVSLRWLSAVYRIGASGEVVWTVVGEESSPIPSSFTLDGDFVGQHHATLVGDELSLFDNRTPPEASRTVTLRLDEGAATASLLEPHSVGEQCGIEGGAVPLPDGGMFATCSTSSTGYEFAAGSGDVPSFTIHAQCGGMGGMGPGRIVPFSLP
jgi:hypothetical protein